MSFHFDINCYFTSCFSYGARAMFQRNPKLGGDDFGDTAVAEVSPYVYESAVDEVARLRSAYAHRDPTGVPYTSRAGDFDDDELQIGIARSLADVDEVDDGQLRFGSSRPKGLVDVLRSVAYFLAGFGPGGYDVPPSR